jgi:hypothetical protein
MYCNNNSEFPRATIYRYLLNYPVLRIRIRIQIRRIRMFLGPLDPDPDPDPLVRRMDPDPSIIKQNYYEKP